MFRRPVTNFCLGLRAFLLIDGVGLKWVAAGHGGLAKILTTRVSNFTFLFLLLFSPPYRLSS